VVDGARTAAARARNRSSCALSEVPLRRISQALQRHDFTTILIAAEQHAGRTRQARIAPLQHYPILAELQKG
jgi:hypothetical protein